MPRYYKLFDIPSLEKIDGRILLFGSGVRGRRIANLLEQFSLPYFFVDQKNKESDIQENKFVPINAILPEDYVFLTADTLKEMEIEENVLLKKGLINYFYFDSALDSLDCNLKCYFCIVSIYGAKMFSSIVRLEQEFRDMKKKYEEINVYLMWSSRVGELIYRFETMQLALLPKEGQYNVIIPYTDGKAGIANVRLMNIFSRYLNIVQEEDSEFWEYVTLYHASELNFERADLYDHYKDTRNYLWEIPYVERIHLNEAEVDEAEKKYRQLHIPGEFVCIHARDSVYLENVYKSDIYKYHNYRDFSINSFDKLVGYLEDNGITVVRVGNGGKEKYSHPNVIDFAMDCYDELLDLYLNSKCKYFIGTDSGALLIPKMFARNVIIINIVSLVAAFFEEVKSGKEIYIPKLLYSRSHGRYITIAEFLEISILRQTPQWKKEWEDDIVYMEDTEEDILDTYIEADKRFCGTWKDDERGLELQQKYTDVLDAFKKKYSKSCFYHDRDITDCLIPYTISTTFLKKHTFLVEN